MAHLPRDHRSLHARGVVECVVLIVILVLPLFAMGQPEDSRGWAALFGLVMASSVIVRRTMVFTAALICAVGAAGLIVFVGKPVPIVVVSLLIVYSAARYRPGYSAWLVWPPALLGIVAGPLPWVMDIEPRSRFIIAAAAMLVSWSLLVSAWMMGRYASVYQRMEDAERRLTEQSFQHRVASAQTTSELLEGRARTEVARELHDVVAHSLSVIVVQAEGARALLEKKPEASGEALDVIAQTGRDSIDEMRRIVGLLRGESGASFGPTPSLSEIPEMVTKAGDRITLEMPDELPSVPDSLGLAVYRVVQESVTNFLKHAGPTAEARVRVAVTSRAISVDVTDDGLGAQTHRVGPQGRGLVGMQERVQTMGGTFHAGPRSGGGYKVRAELPRPAQLGRSWMM